MAELKKNAVHDAPCRALIDEVSWVVVTGTTAVLPFIVSRFGADVFRLPKHLLLEAAAIILATIAAAAAVAGVSTKRGGSKWSRNVLSVIAAVLIWSSLTTWLSTNRVLSTFSLVTVSAATIVFVAVYNGCRDRGLGVLYFALVPAAGTAVLALLQRTALWDPFRLQAQVVERSRVIALLGNPNDVGMFLVAPALAAATLAVVSRPHRVAASLITALLIVAIFATETVGAIGATAIGLFALMFPLKPRLTAAVVLSVLVAGGLFIRLSPTRWSATQAKVSEAVHGNPDSLLSGRLPAFFAAWRMFRHNPVTGVGLGCFSFHYFDEKIAVQFEHPWLMHRALENFGEVHNEHLQILAETGLPGYAIFLSALAVLAQVSFARSGQGGDVRGLFARLLALPLAVGVAVLAVSAFPFRLAAPTENMLFLCAVVLSWSAHADN